MKLFDVYPLYDITPVRAEGAYIYDDKGFKYLDFYGGHAVISIGHSHPRYVKSLQDQISKIGFYSNAVTNPLQVKLARKLGEVSNLEDYSLFLCNSGAEANENALKVASFQTGFSRVIAFKNSFHGRTSATVATTDNFQIKAPINLQHNVTFIELGDLKSLKREVDKGGVCCVIMEFLQGVGGLNEGTVSFYEKLSSICFNNNIVLIADEIQCGYARTGDFFAFQKYNIRPDIITIAKGMGNGFPIGGVMLHPDIKARHGMLGTTFGGNYLACAAAIAVLDIMEEEKIPENVSSISEYLTAEVRKIPQIKKIRGRGLMLGLEFEFDVKDLRQKLIYEFKVFTGNSNNPNLLRILPPLTINKEHVDIFIHALKQALL